MSGGIIGARRTSEITNRNLQIPEVGISTLRSKIQKVAIVALVLSSAFSAGLFLLGYSITIAIAAGIITLIGFLFITLIRERNRRQSENSLVGVQPPQSLSGIQMNLKHSSGTPGVNLRGSDKADQDYGRKTS